MAELLILVFLGYGLLLLLVALGIAAAYAATWVLVVATMLALIWPVRAWRELLHSKSWHLGYRRGDRNDLACLTAVIGAGLLIMWGIALAARFPDQFAAVCATFVRTITR